MTQPPYLLRSLLTTPRHTHRRECTKAIEQHLGNSCSSLGFCLVVQYVACALLYFAVSCSMALTGYSEFLAIMLFRCVCFLLTGYSLAFPYSACLLELALWLNCSILFFSKMIPWSLLQCPVYNGKERQRCCGLCFQGLGKAWLLLYSRDPSLDAEAGGAFKTSPSPKANKQLLKKLSTYKWVYESL